MANSGIYCIKNTRSRKVYIGQSRNINNRKWYHFHQLKKGKHHNRFLQRAYSSYGEEAFVFEILEECSVDLLNEREIFWISKYKSLDNGFGYNLEGGGNVGKEISELVKEAKRGEKNPRFGKRCSEYQVEILRVKNRCHNSTLSERQAADIKLSLLDGEKELNIAKRYGVKKCVIEKIRSCKNFNWVREDLNDSLISLPSDRKSARDSLIVKLNIDGKSRNSIASIVGCTPKTVADVLGNRSKYFVDSAEKQALINAVVTDFNSGMSKSDIMGKYGISSCSYVKYTHDAYKQKVINQRERANELRKSGMMVKDIADLIGVSRMTISKWTK